MKKFVLTFEMISRLSPCKVVIAVIAHQENLAREIASKQRVDKPLDPKVWLDPSQTSCASRRTNKTRTEVDSITIW